MKIDAGKLDRELEILAATETKDEMKQRVTTFTSLATIWGQRLEMRTQDSARAGGRETFAVARYLIRYRANLTTAMRVRIEGILYDILSIEQPDRRATLILTLEEVTAA